MHVPVRPGGESRDVGAGLLDTKARVVHLVHTVGEGETKRVAHAVDGAAVVRAGERWVSGECHARVFLRRGFGWFGVSGWRGAGRGRVVWDFVGGDSLRRKRLEERVLDLLAQGRLGLRRRRARLDRSAGPARRIRGPGAGGLCLWCASAVRNRRDTSAQHRRRQHRGRYHRSCRCRHSVCADTAGARPVCGSSSHVQIYLDIRKLRLESTDLPIVFFPGKKPKESKTRATGGRRLVAPTRVKVLPNRGGGAAPKPFRDTPISPIDWGTDTPVTIPDATNVENSQFLPATRVKIFSRDCRPRDSRITQEKHPRVSLFLSHTWRPITCVFKNISFRVDRAGFCRKSVRKRLFLITGPTSSTCKSRGNSCLIFIILKTRALPAGGQEVVCAIRRTAIRRGGAGAGSRSSVRTSSESPGWHLLGLV